jgi:hypothetical protein
MCTQYRNYMQQNLSLKTNNHDLVKVFLAIYGTQRLIFVFRKACD